MAALAVALLALSLGTYLALGRGAEASGEPLLTLADLPEGAVPFDDNFGVAPEDLSHPLSTHASPSIRSGLAEPDGADVLAYESVRRFYAMVPPTADDGGGAMVISLAYTYPGRTAAQRVADVLVRDLLVANDAEVLGALRGRALRGMEGDHLIWMVATEGRVLQLVVLHGMDDDRMYGLHTAIVEKVARR